MWKEKLFQRLEKLLWRVRYLIIFPVFFLVISLIYLIILMGERLIDATKNLIYKETPFEVLLYLIDIVDFTLIAVIILLIIWWIYELFVRPLSNEVRGTAKRDWILIESIDELKQKLWKVIVISLVVHVFKQILVADLIAPMDLLIWSGAVVLLAASLFLVEKIWGETYEDDSEEKHIHIHKNSQNASWKTD